MKIIAFTGPIGSGKTLAADYLVKHYDFVKINFKDAIIKEIKENLPETLRLLKKQAGYKYINELFLKKPYHPIVRTILQNYGTDVRRKDDVNYWVKKWWATAKEQDKVVVDDVRFMNEFNFIQRCKGDIYRMIRNKSDNSKHISETEQKNIKDDYMIDNNSTKKDLYKILDKNLCLQNHQNQFQKKV